MLSGEPAMRGRLWMGSILVLASCHHGATQGAPASTAADSGAGPERAATARTPCGKRHGLRVDEMVVTREPPETVGPFFVAISGCGFITENTAWFGLVGDQDLEHVTPYPDQSGMSGTLEHEPKVGDELQLGLDHIGSTGIHYEGLGVHSSAK
jgi:hypothetical protein